MPDRSLPRSHPGSEPMILEATIYESRPGYYSHLWAPLLPPLSTPPKAEPSANRRAAAHDGLFAWEIDGRIRDIRSHPHFGRGVHNFLDCDCEGCAKWRMAS